MNNLEIHQESGSEHSRRMKGLSRQAESNDIKFKRSTRRSNKKKKLVVKTGRWEKKESIAFLKGFRLHGKGKWKQIAKSIPTRYVMLCRVYDVEWRPVDCDMELLTQIQHLPYVWNINQMLASSTCRSTPSSHLSYLFSYIHCSE